MKAGVPAELDRRASLPSNWLLTPKSAIFTWPSSPSSRFLRTVELRDLLQGDETMSQIIGFSQKFQRLQCAKDTMLVSNSSLAETSLSHKPVLRNGKLWLAKKYQDLEELTNIIRAKQNKLVVLLEENRLHMVQCLLLKKLSQSEDECETLSQKFTDGRISLENFMESFQRTRKVYHIRLVQSEKIQGFMKPEHNPKRPTKNLSSREPPSVDCHLFPPTKICHVFYGFTPSIILPKYPFYPSCSSAPVHSLYLPPLENHIINSGHLLRPLTSSFQNVHPMGLSGQAHAPRLPARHGGPLPLNNIQPSHRQQDNPLN
ncbi:hypothetical protein UPYG_G00200060 [Umbra pygmaea]|uniref:VPS37 C-terminal domain-containing protein n=1 Tax=Umbra pygmaea TaxID=75934 RepID=A0ABD0X264_UMBPY